MLAVVKFKAYNWKISKEEVIFFDKDSFCIWGNEFLNVPLSQAKEEEKHWVIPEYSGYIKLDEKFLKGKKGDTCILLHDAVTFKGEYVNQTSDTVSFDSGYFSPDNKYIVNRGILKGLSGNLVDTPSSSLNYFYFLQQKFDKLLTGQTLNDRERRELKERKNNIDVILDENFKNVVPSNNVPIKLANLLIIRKEDLHQSGVLNSIYLQLEIESILKNNNPVDIDNIVHKIGKTGPEFVDDRHLDDLDVEDAEDISSDIDYPNNEMDEDPVEEEEDLQEEEEEEVFLESSNLQTTYSQEQEMKGTTTKTRTKTEESLINSILSKSNGMGIKLTYQEIQEICNILQKSGFMGPDYITSLIALYDEKYFSKKNKYSKFKTRINDILPFISPDKLGTYHSYILNIEFPVEKIPMLNNLVKNIADFNFFFWNFGLFLSLILWNTKLKVFYYFNK